MEMNEASLEVEEDDHIREEMNEAATEVEEDDHIREEMNEAAAEVEEDDHIREGTVWTATAHVVTAVIGSAVLALAWSVAQLGWIVGPPALFAFACVTCYTSTLLSDCYRHPQATTGKRNYTYTDAVKAYLGPQKVVLCRIAQYASLWGTMVGHTITSTTSMMAVYRSNCFHAKGHSARCGVQGNLFMIAFGMMEIMFSLFPSLEKITFLSVLAAIMSLAYSFIGLCLCIAKFASHHELKGSLTGVQIGIDNLSSTRKTWHIFQALGNIAFAYTYSEVLIEIQDTLRSPPSENKTMKRATITGLGLTTIFYISLGCIGYAAFGNDAPGNILSGFGFYEPFWLVDIANLCIVIHLLGAYQVFAQPVFTTLENWAGSKWPVTSFFWTVHTVKLPFKEGGSFHFSVLKVALRTILVIFTTFIAILFPFFNAVLGLLGAVTFWPLTIYFPVSMHIAQTKMKKGSKKWVLLQSLNLVCLLVSLVACIGSIADIVDNLKHATTFKSQY